MKRHVLGLIAFFFLVPAVLGQTPAELAQTAAVVATFQNPDGGFGPSAGEPSSLPATSSAIRVLKYTSGSIPDVLACIAYVQKCRDTQSGGFSPSPGGTPDVRTTAVGLMAVSELKIATDEMSEKAIGYLSKNVKGFEDIRIAVAGLEAVNKTSPDFPAWIAQVEADRNPDGTFGQGSAQARATGGAIVALLRMGVNIDPARREAVIAALKAGQKPDGGWSKGDGPSDLESSYRIMRAFFMLKAEPDIDRIRGLLARCRQSDGRYASTPGGNDGGGTYFATILTRWTRLLTGEPPIVETAGFVPIFNGKDLSGWEGDTSLWSAREGMLVGRSPGLDHNEFLATQGTWSDFILKLTFRMIGQEESNSGVQFRSFRVPGHEMSGYQADVGQHYWGCLYDESRRNKILAQADPKALASLRKTGWNEYVIRASGDHIVLSLNGVTSVDYREPDASIPREGRIAVQIHAGGPLEVQFKDISIQRLPTPIADQGNTPGFQLRTIKTPEGDRKFTVFLPAGYDGRKAYPAVLFLHGSGERGDDGIRSAQVGLGAAIHGHPDNFPMIAVFPQARKTWAADSDDARDALAALDDVAKAFKVDPDKVILTGLSMGGSGTWSIAAAHPERFAAIVPICGRGKPETVATLKGLPAWCVVGDADRDATVLNLREMVAALRAAGSSVKEVEYRGVGHNSWDRAYNDPQLIDWMLRQSRQHVETTTLADPAIARAQVVTTSEVRNESVASKSAVRDIAAMFGLDAVRKASGALRKIEDTHHVPVLIETVESLQGRNVNEVAERRYKESGHDGVYILLAKQEHKMSTVLVPALLAEAFTESSRLAIRTAFLDDFKKMDFDAGLAHGVEAIQAAMPRPPQSPGAPAAAVAVAPKSESNHPAPPSPLIERNRVRLTLAGARRIIAAAEARATALGLKDNIAVVDDGGHPIAFERMDGARPASAVTATTKAVSAATFRQATGPIGPDSERPDPLLNLSMQNASAVGGGKITSLRGGLPIVVDGQVIGAVGVGGGTGEQDVEVAKAGVDAFENALKDHHDTQEVGK